MRSPIWAIQVTTLKSDNAEIERFYNRYVIGMSPQSAEA